MQNIIWEIEIIQKNSEYQNYNTGFLTMFSVYIQSLPNTLENTPNVNTYNRNKNMN